MKENWTLTGSKTVYTDPVLRVEHRNFHFKKNDSTGTFTVVKMRNWAVIVPVTKDGKMVLVKQYRVGTQEVAYEFPGGALEEGENPMEGAQRELSEETGFSGDFSALCEMSPNPAFMDNICYTYLAENCEKTGGQNLDPFEDIEPVEFTVEEVAEMILDGRIVHSISIACFGAYKAYLGKK